MQILGAWWADWSSLLGFAIAIILILQSRSAARTAREAAVRASDRIGRALTLTDVASAIGAGREVMRHQRNGAWNTVLDRYMDLKALLVRVREENPDLTAEQRRDIQDCIGRISSLQVNVELKIGKKVEDVDMSRWNRILSEILEVLESLAASCRISVGEST